MIDPIRDPVYQDYQRLKQSKKIDGANTEKGKFNLDYAEEGVLYEPSSEEEDKTSETPKKQAGSFHAAALELRELTDTAPAAAQKQVSPQNSFMDTLRTFFNRALQTLQKFWSTIWESHPADQDTSILTKEELNDTLSDDVQASDSFSDESDGTVTSGNAVMDDMMTADDTSPTYGRDGVSTADRTASGTAGNKTAAQDMLHATNDARILHALKSGDQKHFRSLLSEDGRRIPARNSSLLTYYDAKGHLISPDASVQQRVLHGDRGSMKR